MSCPATRRVRSLVRKINRLRKPDASQRAMAKIRATDRRRVRGTGAYCDYYGGRRPQESWDWRSASETR